MKLAPGPEADFWRAQENMGPVVAGQPGFLAVIGGEIAASSWMYFCGKFATPDDMNAWYGCKDHQPVMRKAHSAWFDAFYIRKWRRPAQGEALAGPLLCETAIVPPEVLPHDVRDATVEALRTALPELNAAPFETAIGEYEPQPFQFVGPLAEFPVPAPVRYLLVTHWDTAEDLAAWLGSAALKSLGALGEVSSDVSVLIRHAPGEREGLNADGSLRSWSRRAST